MAVKWKRLYIDIPEGYIKPEGTVELVTQGEADVTNYASANVNIPSWDGTYEDIKSSYTVTLSVIGAENAYFNYTTDNGLSGTVSRDGGSVELTGVSSISITDIMCGMPAWWVNDTRSDYTWEDFSLNITENTTIELEAMGS